MRIVFSALTLVSCLTIAAPLAFAQRSDVDVFIGYSNLQGEGLPGRNTPSGLFDTEFFRNRTTLHGVNAEVTAFPTNVFGLTGDFSFNRKSRDVDFANGRDFMHTDVYYFMAGPSISFRNPSKVEPFIRVLAGGAHTQFEAASRRDVAGGTVQSSFDTGSTSFAMAAGGGLDVRVSENFKVRALQVDYAPVFLRDRSIDVLGSTGVIQPATLEGQRQDNVRFAVGIVF